MNEEHLTFEELKKRFQEIEAREFSPEFFETLRKNSVIQGYQCPKTKLFYYSVSSIKTLLAYYP